MSSTPRDRSVNPQRLNRRTLLNPAAMAISAMGIRVSWMSCLAKRTRLVCATEIGQAPRCWRNRRRSWRSPKPSRSASKFTLASLPSSAPSSMSASARKTVFEVPRHEARWGAVSGRQRRHGRKPASWAAAAEAKKRQFLNFAVRAGQTGRQ